MKPQLFLAFITLTGMLLSGQNSSESPAQETSSDSTQVEQIPSANLPEATSITTSSPQPQESAMTFTRLDRLASNGFKLADSYELEGKEDRNAVIYLFIPDALVEKYGG